MNEWERLSRQAQRFKKMYPPGTRILLNSMGRDLNPVPDNTRGTISAVDDIGTIFVDFDNGRHFGVIASEDSFRKLTGEELAEEQEEQTADMNEDGSNPVMGM